MRHPAGIFSEVYHVIFSMISKKSAGYADSYNKRIEVLPTVSAKKIPCYHIMAVGGKEVASPAA